MLERGNWLSSFNRHRLCLLALVLWFCHLPAAAGMTIRFESGSVDNQLVYQIQTTLRRVAGGAASDSIAACLADAGYLSARIELRHDTVAIFPGNKYMIGRIHSIVVTSDGQVLEKDIDRPHGAAATRKGIEQIRSALLAGYQNAGYYFASLNTDSVGIGDGTLDLRFRLISGPVVKIGRAQFLGLRTTDTAFVRNLSGLKAGDIFAQTQLELATHRLESAGFLQQDSAPAIIPNESYDAVDVAYFLSERKSSSLELGGGVIPRQGSQPAEFVGRFHLQSLNLFGSGRQFNLLFDRKDRYSTQTEFSFVQPLFIPDHLELSTHLSQIKYDSSYHTFSISGAVAMYTAAGTRLSGEVSWTKTEPQSPGGDHIRTLTATAAYAWSSLDFPANPLAGRTLQFELSYLRRTSPRDSLTAATVDNESMFSIAADNFIPLMRSLVFRLNLSTHVRITARDLLDYSEEFKIGGYGSLRGYRQDQFSGRRIVLAQTELRLRPSRLLAFYPFMDIGYIYTKKEIAADVIAAQSMTRIGSGLGMFVGSGNARLTLEVGWGKDDHVDDGKLHLGLTTLF